MLEEFVKGGFTLRKHRISSVLSSLKEFNKENISGHSGFAFEENSIRENHVTIVTSSFSRSSVFKAKSGRFQITSV